MKQSTTIREALWNETQKCFAVQQTAANQALRIQEVSSCFTFSRDEENCLFTAQNAPVQLAMRMIETATGKVRTVVVRNVDGEWCWMVENMAGSQFEAQELIACVQARIGAKLTGQLTGKAMVN